jgi:hypothetical protein
VDFTAGQAKIAAKPHGAGILVALQQSRVAMMNGSTSHHVTYNLKAL